MPDRAGPGPSVWGSADHPPCPAPFNIAAHVLVHAGRNPERTALEIPGTGERWSYAALAAAVRGTATGLARAGLSPGDRVLLRLGGTVDYPVAYLGAIAGGFVPVATSPVLTAAEIAPMVAQAAPRLVLQADGVAAPRGDVPTIDLATLRAWRSLPPADWHMGDPEREGYIVFTSGTQAMPRGVRHAHRAVWARQMMAADWEGIGPGDRVLHAGAFNWSYTMGTGLLDPWRAGATALVPAEGTEIAALPGLLAHHAVTVVAAVPGVFRRMLAGGLPALPRLRHALSAGEKLPEVVRTDWRAATGTDIHEAFGQSECSTFLSAGPGAPAPPGRLGRAQQGRVAAIVGPEGPVPLGETGTIAIPADDPGLCLGYLDGGGPPTRGGWVLTGDAGAMEEGGWVTYLGREDDVLTAGGYRISPLEIEAAALRCPGVDEAAAFDREVRPGVRVVALAYRGSAGEAAVGAACAGALAPYKRPRVIERRDTLPRNANGKIARRALRAEA